MKRLCMTILILLTCGAGYALPVGNPTEASLFLHGAWWDNECDSFNPCSSCFSWCDAWSFRLGFYGDYVFNRHLKVDNGDNNGNNIDNTQIFTNAGYLAFNMWDRVDVFATLGASNIHIATDSIVFDNDADEQSEAFFPSRFSWSIGARGTLWSCDCFAVGLEGQYFQFKPRFDEFIDYDSGTVYRFDNGRDTRYQEWQVGLGASYRFATSCPSIAMVPYVAVKWSGCRFKLNNFSFVDTIQDNSFRFPNLKNDKSWGFAVGTTLTLCDGIGVTVEGRFADEKAVYVNGQFRF